MQKPRSIPVGYVERHTITNVDRAGDCFIGAVRAAVRKQNANDPMISKSTGELRNYLINQCESDEWITLDLQDHNQRKESVPISINLARTIIFYLQIKGYRIALVTDDKIDLSCDFPVAFIVIDFTRGYESHYRVFIDSSGSNVPESTTSDIDYAIILSLQDQIDSEQRIKEEASFELAVQLHAETLMIKDDENYARTLSRQYVY